MTRIPRVPLRYLWRWLLAHRIVDKQLRYRVVVGERAHLVPCRCLTKEKR